MYWLRSSVSSDLLSLTANRSRSVLAVKGTASPLRALDCSGPIQEGDAVYEGKEGSAHADGPKGEPFGHTSRLSCSRRGEVLRRAVAQSG